MLSGPDLADLIAYARARGAQIILAGDVSQLQAVENGGGMSLLTARLGYARLAEPVRFRNQWEQQASLRLRDGDTSVLATYDQHGRIHGGDPEQTMDAAAAAYTALSTAGTDTLLMAADHALRRELNRRIRNDLIAFGIVSDGPAVRIADGTQASPGDLIICTRNDHTTEAGEPGRTLANGDLLRIEAVTREGLIVRRALDADPRTGQRRWTDRRFLFNSYENSELGYAITDHAAQGRTVHTGLAVITGTEDRQHAYVALSRGTDANHAYVFTASPKRADPVPGPRPAPELARYDKIYAERAGVPVPATAPAAPGTALSVLAAVLDRDGHSAPPPRPATRPSPTPITWPCCTPSGPPRPLRPASSATGSCSQRRRPDTMPSPDPGTGGYGGPCTAPNSPAWTPRKSSPTRSANETSPAPATSWPSSTPVSGTGPAPSSRSWPGRGPRASPPSPIPNAAPTSPRSPS